MNLITREKAKEIDQVWYYTGLSCKNGHLDKRYTNTGICYSCKVQNMKKDYSKNKIRIKETNKKSNLKNKEKIDSLKRKWVENNKEKSNLIKKSYKVRHRAKYLKSARNYSKKKREDPYVRLSKNLSKSIWETLKIKKNRSWRNHVDYSLEDLVTHLECRFKPGMTWDNYGPYWHLDHVRPLSWFNLEIEFDKAWSLSNLQPLEAELNLKKNNRYEG